MELNIWYSNIINLFNNIFTSTIDNSIIYENIDFNENIFNSIIDKLNKQHNHNYKNIIIRYNNVDILEIEFFNQKNEQSDGRGSIGYNNHLVYYKITDRQKYISVYVTKQNLSFLKFSQSLDYLLNYKNIKDNVPIYYYNYTISTNHHHQILKCLHMFKIKLGQEIFNNPHMAQNNIEHLYQLALQKLNITELNIIIQNRQALSLQQHIKNLELQQPIENKFLYVISLELSII